MRKSFWKLQLPWKFHGLLYPEGGKLEPEVSSLSSGTPNTRVISLNMEVFKVLNSSLSWENGSTKRLQGPGFEAWWMCKVMVPDFAFYKDIGWGILNTTFSLVSGNLEGEYK